jgi:RNA polymerase sigma-70 factor, ECF subfamily
MSSQSEEPVQLTLWLRRMSAGDAEAAEIVAGAVYGELKRLARNVMARENRMHSLEPTILVNEAFLRLIRGEPIEWADRKHFFVLASRMMRRIVIDYFRARQADKRPPRTMQLQIEDSMVISEERRDEALMVDQALTRLAKFDERAAQVVEMRYFGGMTLEQVGEILSVHERTVKRDWLVAQAWLRRYLSESAAGEAGV